MSENVFNLRGSAATIRLPEADCATHGAVVPMRVFATNAPEVSAQVCPKCVVEFMGRTFAVTPRPTASGEG